MLCTTFQQATVLGRSCAESAHLERRRPRKPSKKKLKPDSSRQQPQPSFSLVVCILCPALSLLECLFPPPSLPSTVASTLPSTLPPSLPQSSTCMYIYIYVYVSLSLPLSLPLSFVNFSLEPRLHHAHADQLARPHATLIRKETGVRPGGCERNRSTVNIAERNRMLQHAPVARTITAFESALRNLHRNMIGPSGTRAGRRTAKTQAQVFNRSSSLHYPPFQLHKLRQAGRA